MISNKELNNDEISYSLPYKTIIKLIKDGKSNCKLLADHIINEQDYRVFNDSNLLDEASNIIAEELNKLLMSEYTFDFVNCLIRAKDISDYAQKYGIDYSKITSFDSSILSKLQPSRKLALWLILFYAASNQLFGPTYLKDIHYEFNSTLGYFFEDLIYYIINNYGKISIKELANALNCQFSINYDGAREIVDLNKQLKFLSDKIGNEVYNVMDIMNGSIY